MKLRIRSARTGAASSRTRRKPRLLGGVPAVQPPARVADEIGDVGPMAALDDVHATVHRGRAAQLSARVERAAAEA